MNYLPSKKAAIFVAVLIVLAVGGLWYFGTNSRRDGTAGNQPTGTTTANSALFTSATPEQIERSVEPLVIPQIASGQKLPKFNLNDYVRVYTKADLKTTKDNSPETLRAYGLAVAGALKPFSISRENEAQTLIRAIDNKSPEAITSLTNSREVKQAVLKNLLALRVPTEALDLQLSLINSVSKQIAILKNMEQAFRNPILALQSATFWPSEQMRFYRIVVAVNEFFALRKIAFGPEERTQIVSDLGQ